MSQALTGQRARDLAWLRIIEAHAARLGLPLTALRARASGAAARRRWALSAS